MHVHRTKGASLALGAAAVLLAALLFGQRPAASQQQAQATKWEYVTIEVEESSLQAKLGELALEGWEVFSVVNSEMQLEPAPGEQPSIIVTHFTVTGKRPQ